MEKVELYRLVFNSYKELCASGLQKESFSAYCRAYGVEHSRMRSVLKDEFKAIRSLPGYVSTGKICRQIYDEFKSLCAEGKQPCTFKEYYNRYGITREQMHSFQKRNKLNVAGLPGYSGRSGTGCGKCKEIPFEDVIFEEAGFFPAGDTNVITVSVDNHVAVRFPADTDIDVIARFIRKMGKEAGHVGA